MAGIYSRACLVSTTFVILSFLAIASAYDVEIQKIEGEEAPEKIWNLQKFKIIRVRRGKYGLNGTIELLQTLGAKSKVEVKAYYSRNGVEQYKLIPHHLGPKPGCDFLNADYKKYLPSAAKYSTFPEINNEYYCPLKKGPYEVNNFEYEPSSIPAIFKPGFYKVQLITIGDTGDKSTVACFMKVNY